MKIYSLNEMLAMDVGPTPSRIQGEPITWDELVELEPRLEALLQKAQSIEDDKSKKSFCANAAFYGFDGYEGLREKIRNLVGWEVYDVIDPRVQTASAFDAVYRKIYDALPDCRNCWCL